jgi:hypothetical protein
MPARSCLLAWHCSTPQQLEPVQHAEPHLTSQLPATRLHACLQDGMLYMFNLPSSQPDAAAAAAADTSHQAEAAAASAAAQQAAASGHAAVGAPVAGSELMVKGLPDWEPLASQIFRRFVEAIMSKLEEQQQQQHGEAAAAAAGPQGAGVGQQQQQQGYASADAAVAAVQRLLRGGASAMQAAAAALGSRQSASTQQQQQRVQPQELWMAGEMSAAMQQSPGSVAQAEAAIAAGERLLGFAVQQLAGSCAAAAQLKAKFTFGTRQQQHCMSSWEQRATNVAQLMQVRRSARSKQALHILDLGAALAAVVAPSASRYQLFRHFHDACFVGVLSHQR